MDTIREEDRVIVLGWDEVDGFGIGVAKVEVYLKQIILLISVLMVSLLEQTFGTVMLWNFIPHHNRRVAPNDKQPVERD